MSIGCTCRLYKLLTPCVWLTSPAPAAPQMLPESNLSPVSSALNSRQFQNSPWFCNCSNLSPTPSSLPKVPAENFSRPGPCCASPSSPELRFVVGHLHLQQHPSCREGTARAGHVAGSHGQSLQSQRQEGRAHLAQA